MRAAWALQIWWEMFQSWSSLALCYHSTHFVCSFFFLSPPSTLCPYRKVQLPGNQHCGTEQWPGGWWHLHRLHHERRGGGSGRAHRARGHAAAGGSLSPNPAAVLSHPTNPTGFGNLGTEFIDTQRNVAQRSLKSVIFCATLWEMTFLQLL